MFNLSILSVRFWALVAAAASLSGCLDLGVQGGEIPEKFSGIISAQGISPHSIRLTWSLNKRFNNYMVYSASSNTAIKEETFQSTIIGSLSPDSNYSFSVTARTLEGVEEGVGGFSSVRTLPTFTGIVRSNLSQPGPVAVNVTWSKSSDLVEYWVFGRKEGTEWDFTQPMAKVSAADRVQLTNLAEGSIYCFYVVAKYQDGFSEPATTTTAADSNAPCVTTSSDLQGVPIVSMNPVIPGPFPWFTSRSGQENMTIDVFELDTNTRVATRTGNGPFRSFVKQSPGFKKYYALVSQLVNGVTKKAKLDLEIKDGAGANQPGAFIRGLKGIDSVFPNLVSGGRGVQNLGAQMARGDFNCDGVPDLAVSAPTATPYVHPNHVSEMGAVIVYYGESYIPPGTTSVLNRLRTSMPPSTTALAPNAQLIYFPVDHSGFRFGTKMTTGNFNGDCRKFNPANPNDSNLGSCESLVANFGKVDNENRSSDLKLIYRCDDLVVAINPSSGATGSTSTGGVFVIYGDPNSGLVSGSGSVNYGINESTCDASSGTCRAGLYTHNLSTVFHFGKSLAAGDFNNDGFDDLAVGATTRVNTSTVYGRVTVLRGSGQGVFPTTSDQAHVEIEPQSATVYGAQAVAMTTLSPTLEDFAFSVAAIPNSRNCERIATSPTLIPARTSSLPNESGYDFSKCADLIIGDPSRASQRGSIVSCRAGFSATASQTYLTQRKITSWTCREHWPQDLESGAKYGFSLLGVENQNGYPLLAVPTATKADIYGALFVGAPYADIPDASNTSVNGLNAGKVFGYYATPGMKNFDGLQGILGTGAHSVQSNMGVPCNRSSDNVLGKQCQNQVIYNTAAQSGELFGWALGTGVRIGLDPSELPVLLISAPFRTIPGQAGGSNISAGGAVLVYKGDLSVLGTNTQTRIDSEGCAGTGCYYFSGGVNPFGPSLIYNSSSTNNANFGFSPAVGDNYSGETSPAELDIIAAAPYNSNPVEGNGGFYLFEAKSGFPATQSSPDYSYESNVSKEINYRFEQAKVVGDLNGDGYEDIITRSKIGSRRTQTVVYYGSANGLIITPTPSIAPAGLGPKIITSSIDPLLGVNFFPIGDINGDGLKDVLFIGSGASYVYYGSLTGLVSNTEPSVSPVGKNPLKFATSNSTADGILLNPLMGESTVTAPAYDVSNQAVAFGDFNADGFGDFAVGLNINISLPSGVDISGLGTAFSASQMGRVLVIYGSSKGPQIGSGGFIRRRLDPTSNAQADVVAKNPCSPDPDNITLQKCFVQLLASPGTAPGNFGFALASVKSMETLSKADGLVIGDPNANTGDGQVYYMRGSLSGINQDPTSVQTIPAQLNGSKNGFGYLISSAQDINGDKFNDIVVSAPATNTTANNRSGVYVFYGSPLAGQGRFAGIDTFTTSPPTMNAIMSSSKGPQWFVPVDLSSNTRVQYGYGLSSIGDFNNDGYSDVMVNVPKGNFELDVLKPEAGYTIIYFGSTSGLRTNSAATVNPRCYGYGTTDEICEPIMNYLPDSQSYENTYVSNSASGDINGDGIIDLVIGGFGRNHPSGLAFSSGVFYVLY